MTNGTRLAQVFFANAKNANDAGWLLCLRTLLERPDFVFPGLQITDEDIARIESDIQAPYRAITKH
jgi:hypothetical protein